MGGSEEKIEFEGEVTEALRGRMYRIRVMLGDRVRVELSPYDLTRGRIVYRLG